MVCFTCIYPTKRVGTECNNSISSCCKIHCTTYLHFTTGCLPAVIILGTAMIGSIAATIRQRSDI